MRTQKERREYYRKMKDVIPQGDLMYIMPDDELRMNVRKGGVDAIAEFERRETKKVNHIISQPEIDIGI